MRATPHTLTRKPGPPVHALRWVGPTGVAEDGDLGALLDELAEFGAKILFEHPGTLKVLAGVGGAQGFVPVPPGHWIFRAGDHFYPVAHEYVLEHFEFVG